MQKQKVVINSAHALLRPAVWSNLFFLAPFFTALYFESFSVAVLVGVVLASSIAYHTFNESYEGFLLWNDRFFALLLTLVTAGLVGFGGFTFPYFQIIAALTVVAFLLFRKQWTVFTSDVAAYEWYHTAWHFSTALISALSIISFYM